MKVAVVTGASRGIGLAVARRLSRDGMAVAGLARDGEALAAAMAELRAEGREAWAITCDVGSEAEVDRAFGEVMGKHGTIDVVVNNAGVFERSPIDQMPLEAWERVMRVNATGVFLCCRAAFRAMKGKGGGDIVNVSSLAGVRNVEKFAGTVAYVASKHAVAGITEALAAEGKPHGIRVKAVSPGAVETELLARSGNELKAGISADELAGVIAFLVSDEARALSGTNVEIFSNA